jgi:hypothetical protein
MDNIEDLVGKPLDKFRVLRMTEVYRTDTDGRFTKSEGCLKSEAQARAYANGLGDSGYVNTRSILVLTDGEEEAYFLGDKVLVADISTVLDSIRIKALAKLTPEEIQVLGL